MSKIYCLEQNKLFDFTNDELEKIDLAEQSLKKINQDSIVIAKKNNDKILVINALHNITRNLPNIKIHINDDKFSFRHKYFTDIELEEYNDNTIEILKNIFNTNIRFFFRRDTS
jgi:hypothetical protein